MSTPPTTTTDPAEAIRRQVEQALEREQVDLTRHDGRERTLRIIEQAISEQHANALNDGDGALSAQQRTELAGSLRDDLIGLGAIAERMLTDETAQEWMVNSPKRIFRDTGQRIERVPDLSFADDQQVRAFLERLLEQTEGKRLDRITPRIEARLPDGSRLTAAIPPISSNGHVICSIRRFTLAAETLDELVAPPLQFLSGEAADFLSACVRASKNILVSGRVSSGKTTLLNSLGRAIPGGERVVLCESSAELRLPTVLPNCIGYEARPASTDGLTEITLENLVADALRSNPDRIIIGECRGPETMAMLWAIATGHAGMTSVHGESAEHALTNLARFALISATNIQSEQALQWLREINVVIHCDRPRSHQTAERLPRRIDEIVEVTGVEGSKLTLNPLFSGSGSELHWNGSGPAFLADLEEVGYEAPQ